MSWSKKVVWSEGMFLQPQHFQQQDRYFERALENRAGEIATYPWGFAHLAVDESALAFPRVYVSGGRRGLDLSLSPSDLVRATSATTAAIAR